jgi:hypothetical protein
MKVASREPPGGMKLRFKENVDEQPPGGMKLRFKENVDEQSTNIIIETQN